MADRIGSKKVSNIVISASMISVFLFGFTSSIEVALILRVIMGLSSGEAPVLKGHM